MGSSLAGINLADQILFRNGVKLLINVISDKNTSSTCIPASGNRLTVAFLEK